MAKRFIDTEIWNNTWFMDLLPIEKIMFFYIVTKCDYVGVWNPNFRLASFVINSEWDLNWNELLKKTKGNIEVLENGKWFLPDFCKFQYGELSEQSRPHQTYIKKLKEYGLLNRVVVNNKSNTMSAKRKRLTQKKKDEILSKYKYECQYCGEKNCDMVVDHITPLIKGGDNSDDNLICTCVSCNSRKSDLSLQEFYDNNNGVYKNLDRVYNILNTLKEKEKEKEKEKDKEKDKKHKYGEFKNVLLTDKEVEKLKSDYGNDRALELINKLDEGIELKGYKYKNHNLAIRKWYPVDTEYKNNKKELKLKEEYGF